LQLLDISSTTGNTYIRTSSNAQSGLDLNVSVSSAVGPVLYSTKTRGTASSKTIVSSGDSLFALGIQGYDGATNAAAASINFSVDGAPGSNDMPGRITFATTPDGTAAAVERMRIDNSGNVGIGTTSPVTKLDVAGTVKIADGSEPCTIAANGGMLRYTSNTLQFCNGSSWQTLGV